MAQQKQRKQLPLTDDKNSFTYCFQSIQRLQLNSKTYAIRNFKYTKHNGDNPKSRIFSFIPQRRRIQPNFMNHTYQTTNQTNTNQTTETTTSTWVSPLTQSLCSYNWGNANFGEFIFKFQPFLKKLIFSQFSTFRRFRKVCTWLDEQFRTFQPSLHESVTSVHVKLDWMFKFEHLKVTIAVFI